MMKMLIMMMMMLMMMFDNDDDSDNDDGNDDDEDVMMMMMWMMIMILVRMPTMMIMTVIDSNKSASRVSDMMRSLPAPSLRGVKKLLAQQLKHSVQKRQTWEYQSAINMTAFISYQVLSQWNDNEIMKTIMLWSRCCCCWAWWRSLWWHS